MKIPPSSFLYVTIFQFPAPLHLADERAHAHVTENLGSSLSRSPTGKGSWDCPLSFSSIQDGGFYNFLEESDAIGLKFIPFYTYVLHLQR